MLPAAIGGPSAGQLALGYYRTTNGVTDHNNGSATWTYTVAETSNATSATPTFEFADINPGVIYHPGDICNSGTICGLGLPGTGSNRNLSDFTSAAMDSDGCALFAFAGDNDPPAASPTVWGYVAHQKTGCFAQLSATVPEAPWIPALVLFGSLGALIRFSSNRFVAGKRRANQPAI
jgi:hypothetical protein